MTVTSALVALVASVLLLVASGCGGSGESGPEAQIKSYLLTSYAFGPRAPGVKVNAVVKNCKTNGEVLNEKTGDKDTVWACAVKADPIAPELPESGTPNGDFTQACFSVADDSIAQVTGTAGCPSEVLGMG